MCDRFGLLNLFSTEKKGLDPIVVIPCRIIGNNFGVGVTFDIRRPPFCPDLKNGRDLDWGRTLLRTLQPQRPLQGRRSSASESRL
jgi:hypothetical protein